MDAEAWDARYASSELVRGGQGRNAIGLARRGWQATAADVLADVDGSGA